MSKPDDFPWLAPYLAVEDVERSMAFYGAAFGFTFRSQARNDEGNVVHGEMNYQDCVILMGTVNAYEDNTQTPKYSQRPSPIVLYVYVDDVDQFYEAALTQGAESVMPVQEMPWGDRTCHLKDLDGYIWAFATNIKPCPNANQ